MNIATFLMAMVTPLAGKLMVSLGVSVVTVTGMTLVTNQLKDQFVNSANTLPADMLNVFLLAGGGIGVGMVFGALTTRLVLWQIMNGTKILGVNPG